METVSGLGFDGGRRQNGYDLQGNLKKYTQGNMTYTLTYDVEGHLTCVRIESAGLTQTTSFFYDANGQRVKTTRPDGTILYTPFPDYEVEDPPGGGANTVRITYRLAGQIVAVQTKVGTAAGAFHYTYTDHLGNVVALSNATGGYLANSLARYDPFGNYRTEPAAAVNPGQTNHGYTGHRRHLPCPSPPLTPPPNSETPPPTPPAPAR